MKKKKKIKLIYFEFSNQGDWRGCVRKLHLKKIPQRFLPLRDKVVFVKLYIFNLNFVI